MRLPEDVRRILERAYARRQGRWLADDPASPWPWEIGLRPPSEGEALRQVEGVRAWVAAWRAWRGPGAVVWGERRWRVLGTQQVPERLVLGGPGEVAAWLGEGERWERARRRYGEWVARWPSLAPHLARRFPVLADYPDPEFRRLGDLLAWIEAHPRSGLYPRQVPLAGMDSKWVEAHGRLVADLWDALRGEAGGGDDFYARCGLRAPPRLVRLRLLDPALRRQVGGLGDVTAPCEEVAALDLPVNLVFVVENRQTGLAFPDLPGAVVFLGLGYQVDLLAQLPWVARAEGFYWGDLDTHGFAILSRARAHLPGLRSFLMDEETLLRHRDLWTTEQEPHPAAVLPRLEPAESALYRDLKRGRWGVGVRLEQERIAWDYVLRSLDALPPAGGRRGRPL